MNHPALDAYLDELLDLTVDAVAPAPVAANAPTMADEPVIALTPAIVSTRAAEPPSVIDLGLLAELDSDPLFAGQSTPAEHKVLPLLAGEGWEGVSGAQAPGSEPSGAVDFASRGGSNSAAAVENVAMAIDADLLAELDSDPLFAASMPAIAPVASQIDPALLAELESDPLFAGVMASTDATTPQNPVASPELMIDPGLLAELDSDPLFAALMAEPAAPAPVAPPAPPRRPAPARNAMPQPDPRSGLRPVEVTPPSLMPTVTTTHRWLRVAVGEDSYAVELLRVQEVGRTVPIVAMRGAAPSVLGAMNLRGRIVPVFDLGLWLGTGRVTPDERARIVVVERDNELIGALVTAVDDVVTLGPDRIEPPLMASPSRAIVGVARVVAKPTVLLDANALFG